MKYPERQRFQQTNDVCEKLKGYRDMGMKKPALALCRELTRQRVITPEVFLEIVITVGMFAQYRRWLPMLEEAVMRQAKRRVLKLSHILGLYAAMYDDYPLAAKFFRSGRISPEFAWHAMKSWLETGDTTRANRYYHEWDNCLFQNGGAFDPEASYYGAALGEYCMAHADWKNAIDYFEIIHPEHPMAAGDFYLRASLCNIARSYIGVLCAIRKVATMVGDEIAQHGNMDAVKRGHLRTLERQRRALGKLIPREMLPTLEAQAIEREEWGQEE